MAPTRKYMKAAGMIAGATCLCLTAAGCSSGGGPASTQTKGVTIKATMAGDPPPKAALDAFTKKTGIKVNWTTVDWDSLQTKISAAATAKTYFADVTDVDWSRVGQLGKLDWFYPMEKYLNTKKMAKDMPQMDSFTLDGHVIGIPEDASFMVTTVNKKLFAKAGIKKMPTTIGDYTKDLKQIKSKGVVKYPLNIPFAAAEGLSTYWYQTTGAFGGTILDGKGRPQFTSPDSAGYKAAQWMISALKNGLVRPGSINVADSEGQQTLMAKGTAATTFSDYSGNVGSLYNIPKSSTVTNQVEYIPTPGATGVAPNLNNPDGVGIPKKAKYPNAAAKFIKWLTSAKKEADFAGANGKDKVQPGYFVPSRLSAMKELTNSGHLDQGKKLSDMLESSTKPVFPQGAPSWYPEFSQAVYTNLHAAATGSKTASAAIKAMSEKAKQLASGS
ncbi:ABC transporter substrate-binding protein [Spelaeicoccus albus]|uniref:Multiple sugar transport system substrate-binding protein n=1 Tax=Spelaeicoccus albus TaxID=1280376 RepID=A0A7Z0D1X9_9MICO|nr:extracellular solute-binding protein [Spelaeicoccus albus]NYI67120.1 multiple sugar transport system substrate-binding protein [Spelaeicoccus albus]